MSTQTDFVDKPDEPQSSLPPVVCLNLHKKLEPEKVDVNDFVIHTSKPKKVKQSIYCLNLVKSLWPEPKPELPVPLHPLNLTWYPEQMYFNLDTDVIVNKLWILNSSLHPLNIICCGFWDDTARMGASWCCYPRTRIYLAPGLRTPLSIKATPRFSSPVPLAYIGLQLCANHRRDNVSGYFVVPIVVKFNNYVQPYCGEGA